MFLSCFDSLYQTFGGTKTAWSPDSESISRTIRPIVRAYVGRAGHIGRAVRAERAESTVVSDRFFYPIPFPPLPLRPLEVAALAGQLSRPADSFAPHHTARISSLVRRHPRPNRAMSFCDKGLLCTGTFLLCFYCVFIVFTVVNVDGVIGKCKFVILFAILFACCFFACLRVCVFACCAC